RPGASTVLRFPLIGTGRALGELPFVAEQILEEVVAPLRRRLTPDDFRAAGDRVAASAGAIFALPAEALLFDGGGLRFRAHQGSIARAGGLAEGMPAGNQPDRLFVIQGHPAKRSAVVPGRRNGIRLAVRSFRIDVDQAHLHRGERALQITVAAVALVREPLA